MGGYNCRRYVAAHWKQHQERPAIHPTNVVHKDMVREIISSSNIKIIFRVVSNDNKHQNLYANDDNKEETKEIIEQTTGTQPTSSQSTAFDMSEAMFKDLLERK